jgi:hypothetical protein
MATVARNSIPMASAAVLSLFLLNKMLDGPLYVEANWEAISRNMDVMASHKLMSLKVKAICISYSSSMRYWISVVFPFWVCSSFSIVIGFPVAFASAHAMALDIGQPMDSCVVFSLLVSSQSWLKMCSFSLTVIVSSCASISASSAISNSSTSKFGSFTCRSARLIAVKGISSRSSNNLDRLKPVGARLDLLLSYSGFCSNSCNYTGITRSVGRY